VSTRRRRHRVNREAVGAKHGDLTVDATRALHRSNVCANQHRCAHCHCGWIDESCRSFFEMASVGALQACAALITRHRSVARLATPIGLTQEENKCVTPPRHNFKRSCARPRARSHWRMHMRGSTQCQQRVANSMKLSGGG